MLEASARPEVSVVRRRVLPIKFLIGGAIIFLAIGYLVLTGLSTASVYYLTVSELQAQGLTDGRAVRVSGDVVPGSIVRDGSTLRFQIADPGGSLPVTYQGIVPDIFADNVQVVVEGKVRPDGSFLANSLLAKCPSKFETEPMPGSGSA